MVIIQLLILGVLLLAVPMMTGILFSKVNRDKKDLAFLWVSGQILLWAGFLVISIPLILLEKSFSLTCMIFNIYTVAVAGLGIFAGIKQKKNAGRKVSWGKNLHKKQCFLWVMVILLLMVQIVMTVFYAYEEGDDAFYIAISTITQDADTMYRKLPYTGGFTGLDVRHSLAPFPIWIAYLARMSGMPAVSVAQIILPLSLIGMAYAIYYLIAARLFKGQENRIPIFMIFVELLVLFGGYSVYTVENFLLVRASQGKAVIANIILPVLFYLLMLIMDKLQENEKVSVKIWFLMTFTCMAGCLCTTLGTILTCMLVGCGGLVGAVCYRKPKILVPMAMSCIIPVGIALLYFLVH